MEEINIEDLVDLRSIAIDMNLPVEEREKEFLRQIKNPYLFRYDAYVVEISVKGDGEWERLFLKANHKKPQHIITMHCGFFSSTLHFM